MTEYIAPIIISSDIRRWSEDIHADNVAAGWWSDLKTGERLQRNVGELLMLIVSEGCEGADGLERNLMDDKLPHREMIEVELADQAIRIFDFIGGLGLTNEAVSRFDYYQSTEPGKRELAAFFAPCRNPNHYLLRIIRFCAAAMELDRKKREGVGQQMALALHGIFILGELLELDVVEAMAEKREFNRTRADHQKANRLLDDGKRY